MPLVVIRSVQPYAEQAGILPKHIAKKNSETFSIQQDLHNFWVHKHNELMGN